MSMTLREQYAAAVTRGRDLAHASQRREPLLPAPAEQPAGVVGRPLGEAPAPVADRVKLPRGFAVMPKGRVAQIGQLGGIAAHAKGTAHEWTVAEARAASRKAKEHL